MELPARHPRKGDCVIRERAHTLGRIKVFVDYPDLGLSRRPEYLDELVDRSTSKPISLDATPETPTPRPSVPQATPSWQTARQTLLALRLGQSTSESVKDLSVGMSEVDEACRWALDRAATGKISFLLFESPYGMGKSHALAHLRLRAQQAGMAAGGVVLDGISVSLCLPMSIIAALSHTIEFPDGPSSDGLPQRLAGLIRTGATERLRVVGSEMLFSVLRKVDPTIAENPDSWEVIEDFLSLEVGAGVVRNQLGLVVPSLKSRLCDRPQRSTELLREWAQACTTTGARNGLVVLLDEADVDYSQSGRTETEREQRVALLQAWREVAGSGPQSGGYGRLVIAMAITPGASEPDPVEELQSELGSHLRTVRLTELAKSEMSELGSRVSRLYRTAYQLPEGKVAKMDAAIAECLGVVSAQAEGRNPRKFIRMLLERLDVANT
jgi:hypothetical protein